MHYLLNIFAFSNAVVFTLVFSAMALGGLRRGRIYYEPSCAPIPFRTRPVAFLALCSFYLGCATFFAVLSVRVAAGLVESP